MSTDTLVIDALATARLTKLVTTDRLTRPLRRRAIRAAYHGNLPKFWDQNGSAEVLQDPDAPELAYLLSCDWCAGLWCAIIVLCLRRFLPGIWGPLAKALAASQVTGTIHDFTP